MAELWRASRWVRLHDWDWINGPLIPRQEEWSQKRSLLVPSKFFYHVLRFADIEQVRKAIGADLAADMLARYLGAKGDVIGAAHWWVTYPFVATLAPLAPWHQLCKVKCMRPHTGLGGGEYILRLEIVV